MPIPVFDMRYTRYPIAVLIMPNKTVEFISMRTIKGRFFVCKYGVYQVENKYAYRYGKQLVYFYDSTNGKPIDLDSINKLMSFLIKEGYDTLMECKSMQNLRRIEEEVKATMLPEAMPANEDYDQDYNIQDCVNNISSLDPDVKRFVCSYSEHDDDGLVSLITEVHHRKKMFESYSKNMRSTFPKLWSSAAIIELPNRHIDILKLPLKTYSFSKYGILEQRKGYAYNSKRQQLYFYPIDPNSRVLEKKDIVKLKKAKEEQDVTPLLQEYGIRQPMMINTNFSLVGLRAYDPMIVYIFASEIQHGHGEIRRLSKRQKKPIPMILVIVGILGFAILMSNLSGIITSVGEQADKFLGRDDPIPEQDRAPGSEETLTAPVAPTISASKNTRKILEYQSVDLIHQT